MANSTQSTDQYDNPYFLHSSDHAGLILVSDRLTTGADFHSWRKSTRMALNVRNKLGFIDGTILKPSDTHRDFGSWSRCNDMVPTWIMNSVSKKIGQSLLFIPTAEGIWNSLMSRFKQDDAPRVYEIEQRLDNIQQGALDVSSYYTELVTLWEEYRNYVELHVCTCGKCECNVAVLWEKLQHRSRVTKFLMGLNESFESTRRHILMLKPIPSIEDVFNMVTQDERQKNIKPMKSESVVFQASDNVQDQASFAGSYDNAAFAIHNGYKPRPSRPLCTYCGQSGHVIQKCFKKHGYPPGYIPGFKSSGAYQQQSNNPQFQAPTQFQPRGQTPTPKFQSHAVANVITGSSMPPATSTGLMDVNQLTMDQVQKLVQQLHDRVNISENSAPISQAASITENGVMANQSTSGTLSLPNSSFPSTFPSSSLRFENNHLTFQHQCLSSLSTKIPHGSWIIDSGATSHVCSDLAMFNETFTVSGVTVSLPNEARVDITHCGTVQLSQSLILHDVLHVPSFKFNLISVSSLLKHNQGSAHFFPDFCYIQESIQGLMIGRGLLLHNLYILQPHTSSPSSSLPSVATPSSHFSGSLKVDGNLWHQRVGHPSSDKLKLLSGTLPITTLPSQVDHCPVCPIAKQKRLSFESHNHMSSSPFDLIHLDVWGPFAIESVEGFKYFLTIVDDCTRVTWIYMLRNKSEVSKYFAAFIIHVQTQYSLKIKKIRTDNAPELAFTELVRTHGIIHQFSCAYTPQQNSVVERKHQHLLNVARALLFQSDIPISYWSDCILTAVFLINRIPSVLLKNKSPYELLNKKAPDYKFLRSFGCLCYVSTLQKDRNKFSPRADQCVFLGYSSGYKGYKVLHLENNLISVSRNVVFHETIFPFKNDKKKGIDCDIFDHNILPLPISLDLDFNTQDHSHDNSTSHHASTSSSPSSIHQSATHTSHSSDTNPAPETVTTETTSVSLPIVRPRRPSKAPGYLSNYHCSFFQNTPLPTSKSKITTPYPLSSVLTYQTLTDPYKAYICSISIETEPKNF